MIWHVRGPSWDGYLGLDVLQLAREALGLSIATEETRRGCTRRAFGPPARTLSTERSTRSSTRSSEVDRQGIRGRGERRRADDPRSRREVAVAGHDGASTRSICETRSTKSRRFAGFSA
jgi:hypothetical protein